VVRSRGLVGALDTNTAQVPVGPEVVADEFQQLRFTSKRRAAWRCARTRKQKGLPAPARTSAVASRVQLGELAASSAAHCAVRWCRADPERRRLSSRLSARKRFQPDPSDLRDGLGKRAARQLNRRRWSEAFGIAGCEEGAIRVRWRRADNSSLRRLNSSTESPAHV